jgi:flagellin
MRIQHNIMAMNAYRNYNTNNSALSSNLEKLSSGYKINRAGDDAAGLAISEKMRAQISGLEQASNNVDDGISLVKTAEGALQEVQDMLNRMVELATQSANGPYDDSTDRANLQAEVDALTTEINRIADSSNFNGINLLDGSLETAAAQDAKTVTGNEGKVITSSILTSTVDDYDYTLHSDGVTAAAGSFTISLDQLSIDADHITETALKFTIGGAEVTVEAADADTDLTADDIADLLVDALNGTNGALVATVDGTLAYSEDGTYKAKVGDLVYAATKNNDGSITFTSTKVATAAGTDVGIQGTGADYDDLTGGVPDDQVAAAAVALDLNLDVSVEKATAAGGGTSTSTLNGTTNVGTISWDKAEKTTASQLGSAEFTIDTSKLQEGTVISILGDTKTITLDGSKVDGEDADIDLSGLDLTTDEGKTAAVRRIADAYGTSNDNVTVGVNASGNLTIAEKGNPTAKTVSADTVTDAAKTAMSTVDDFSAIISFTAPGKQVSSTLSDAETFVREGGSVKVGDQTFTFTRDPSSATAAANTTYVSIEDGLDGLKEAISTKFGNEVIGSIDNKDGNFTIHFAEGTDGLGVSYLGGNGLTLQIGDTSDSFNQLTVGINDMHAYAIGSVDAEGNLTTSISDISIGDSTSAQNAIQVIKDAINQVSSTRGKLGAVQNRLEHTSNNLSVMTENIQDAESTIRDTDIAEEMMAYTKNNILVQSAQAMLAQANQVPQGVLQLLQ